MLATELMHTLLASGVEVEEAARIVAATIPNTSEPVTAENAAPAKGGKTTPKTTPPAPDAEYVKRLKGITSEPITSGHLKGGKEYGAVKQGRGKVLVQVSKRATDAERAATVAALRAIAADIEA